VVEELRRHYHDQMEEVEGKVRHLFALVVDGIPAATDALLSGDPDVAHALAAREVVIEGLYREAEAIVVDQLALQAPVATELRYFLAVLRVVPELERSHDLVEHIARRGAQGLREELTPRTRGLVERMGGLGREMWQMVGDAWSDRDPAPVDVVVRRDDEMDELHVSLVAELAAGKTALPVAMDMALVARFYERLGDHAVNIGQRVRTLGPATPPERGQPSGSTTVPERAQPPGSTTPPEQARTEGPVPPPEQDVPLQHGNAMTGESWG
jgi:phosphate transport system protein